MLCEHPRSMSAQYRVKLTTSGIDLFVASDETVLSRALDEGLSFPFKCRAGNCTTCKAKLVSGTLDQTHAAALTPQQKEEGWVLLCVGKPLSDCAIEM